jgi:hypothetical protein
MARNIEKPDHRIRVLRLSHAALKAAPLTTHHYRQKHVTCNRPEAQTPACLSWPLVKSTMGPPVMAQLDDNIWPEIISTPSPLQCSAQTQSPNNKGILSIALHTAGFVFVQTGTGTGFVMSLPFRIRVTHVLSSNTHGAKLCKLRFDKCPLTLVNSKTEIASCK